MWQREKIRFENTIKVFKINKLGFRENIKIPSGFLSQYEKLGYHLIN